MSNHSGFTALTKLTLAAGTTSNAPLVFTSGTNLTSPVAGAVEFDGTSFYVTPVATRKTLAYLDSNITGNTTGTAAGLSATLAVASGGTGATTLTGVLKGNGTSAFTAGATLADLGTTTADFSMNSHKITSLTDPSSNQDAATKAYVDSVATGLDAKASCRVATTVAGTLASSFENGDTVDGVVLSTGDRILIKNQVAGETNGIYTVNASGAPTRATDADTDAEVTSGMFTFITAGTTNANTGWVLSTTGAITLNTTPLTFTQFSAATSVVAGTGLTLSGSTLDVVGTTNRITANTDSIDISSAYVGQATITTLGTVGTGTWQGTAVGVAYGGTGQTTYTNGQLLIGNTSGNTLTKATLTAGTAISITNGTGSITINNTGVTSITGTTNQVVVDVSTGAVTLSLPQSIATTSTPTFDALTITSVSASGSLNVGANGTTNPAFLVYSNAASQETGLRVQGKAAGGAVQVDVISSGTNENLTINGKGTGTVSVNTLVVGSTGIVTSGTWNGTTIALANGGTGQTTKTASMNALSPLTTQGDIMYHNGTDSVRLAKGTANQHFRMNSGATAPEWATVANRNLVELSSDVASTASTSNQNITGMSFSVTSGTKYRFFALIVYTASATTIGLRLSLTTPTATLLAYNTRSALSTTATATNQWTNGQATSGASSLSSTSSPTTTGNIAIIEGYILPSASGTVQLQFAPETATASGIVIKAGSTVEYW